MMATITISINGVDTIVNRRFENSVTINTNSASHVEARPPVNNVKEIIKMIKRAKLKKRTDQADCPICLCELNNVIVVPCCIVGFCNKCLIKSLKEREVCPTCRAEKCIKD